MFFKNLKESLNGANLITLAGLLLTTYVIVLRFNGKANILTAILTFSIIATDFLDGYCARKYDCKTYLGAALDRIRDKFLSVSYFWFILISYQGGRLFLFLTAIIVSLFSVELTLLIASIWGVIKKKPVDSNQWGQRKMFFECVGMIAWVIFNDLAPFGISHTNIIPAGFIILCFMISFFLAGMSLRGYWDRYFGN